MGRTDQLARCSAGRYLTFDPAEVTGCSATVYATDTRQSVQLHSLRAGRLSSPTPPHYAYVCVLRWDLWAVRGPCLAVVEARMVVSADWSSNDVQIGGAVCLSMVVGRRD